jgi:hypothetical protein
VAGDVIDGPGMLAWLAAYRRGLDEEPAVWGLHDYYDTTYFRTAGLEDMIGAVPGEVWLTETGGIVSLRTRDGAVSLPADELRARASVSFAFEEARAFSSRVGRMYLYQWLSDGRDRFDAGLVRADGSARPALDVVRTQVAALAAAGGAASAAAAAQGAVPGALTIRASGAGTLRLRCPARVRCAGAVWIEDARLSTVTLVNGRLPGWVLSPRRRALAPARGDVVRVRFRVPRSVLVRAWPHRRLSLRLKFASPAAPFALGSTYVADAWRPVAVTHRPRTGR